MARPLKTGLDYFDLDCYMDDKIKTIQAEFGLKGFAIVIKLYQMIYRGRGYYCEWNEKKKLLFVHEECSDCGDNLIHLIDGVIKACIREGVFSEKLFTKYSILTSRGIQKRYFNAVSKRKKVEYEERYLLISVAHNSINVDNNRVNDVNNRVNDVDNTQRRVEKGFYNLTEFQQGIIKEVCCEQANFEYENADEINTILSGYSINGVSAKFGESWNVHMQNGVAMKRDTYALLCQTGLCCRLAR